MGSNGGRTPGYHTAVDYLRFGRSLVHPLFSGFAGFADGIYSTLWGDALCGGASSLTFAWHQQPLVAGYLWALIPTALIVIGAVVAIIQFVRKPSSELFLLLGFSAVLMLGLIFMTLKIPSYAQAKAFYALSAITPLCFFGALGWETTTHVSERLRFVLGTLVLVWATSSFATYWITPSVAQHLYAAKALAVNNQIDRANAEAATAVQVDPLNATARGLHALSLSELGDDVEAREGSRARSPVGSDGFRGPPQPRDHSEAHRHGTRNRRSPPRNRARAGKFFSVSTADEVSSGIGTLQRGGRVRTGMAGGIALRRDCSFFCGCGNGADW